MKLVVFLGLLAGALAECNWGVTTDEWYCVSCGGDASCEAVGTIGDPCSTDSLPPSADCPLPPDRTEWICCYDCNVITATQVCSFYAPPAPAPVPPPPIDDDGLDDSILNRHHGLNTLDIVLIAVAATAVVAGAGTAFFFWNRRRGYQPINQG